MSLWTTKRNYIKFTHLLTVYSTEISRRVNSQDHYWTMNWRVCGRKQWWSKLQQHPDICLQVFKKMTRAFHQDSLVPNRDLNPEFPGTQSPTHDCDVRWLESPKNYSQLLNQLSKFLKKWYDKREISEHASNWRIIIGVQLHSWLIKVSLFFPYRYFVAHWKNNSTVMCPWSSYAHCVQWASLSEQLAIMFDKARHNTLWFL